MKNRPSHPLSTKIMTFWTKSRKQKEVKVGLLLCRYAATSGCNSGQGIREGIKIKTIYFYKNNNNKNYLFL